jgi:hypothetical protein
MNRINEIKQAASDYGRRSIENMEVCRTLGRAIIKAFDKYLTLEGDVAIGVPLRGDWDPKTGDYRDATFSFHGRKILRIENVQFGIGVRIDNLRDDGALWLRIVVNLRKYGEKIGVFVEDKSEGFWIPVDYKDSHLQEICDGLYRVLLQSFREDTQIFVEGSGRYGTIGFTGAGYR